MAINLMVPVVYQPKDCAVFFRTRERFGALSNMASGFPLTVGDYVTATSEALYQACRYPHLPAFQHEILCERNPMTAKMRSRTRLSETRADWPHLRVAIMDCVLRVKLMQHQKAFGSVLLSTGDLDIVEKSNKDAFWGAKPQKDESLLGINVLGQLLTVLRSDFLDGHWAGNAENAVNFLKG